MPEVTLILNELDCANCANKIERAVQKKLNNDTVSVSFATKTLVFVPRSGEDVQEAINRVIKIVKETESSVHITVKTEELDKPNPHKQGERFSFWFNVAKLAIVGLMLVAMELMHLFEEHDHHHHEEAFYQSTEFWIALVGYIIIGYPIVVKAIKHLFRGKIFDEYMLMLIATLGAFAIGNYHESVAVMFFFQVGELLHGIAIKRTRKSVEKLMVARPEFANIIENGKITKVLPSKVRVGTVIQIRPGELVPLDGKVKSGSSLIDTSSINGDTRHIEVGVGAELLSGSVNLNGTLELEVTKEYNESTASKIIELVANASNKKANAENFITKFARWYTPIVVGLAILIAVIPPMVLGWANFTEWLERGLIFLVISCPCAMVISVPLAYFGGMGAASKKGILVKGSNHLEALNALGTVVLEKNSTLFKNQQAGQRFKIDGVKNVCLIDSSQPDLTLREGANETYANLKVKQLEEVIKAGNSKQKVAYVGVGLNDAPALARADIGIAMGGVGSDAAIGAADIVLMNDDVQKISEAIKVAKRTRRIVWQNIIFAIGVKVVVLALSAFGITSMWAAVFADAGVTLIAVLNSMRAMLK